MKKSIMCLLLMISFGSLFGQNMLNPASSNSIYNRNSNYDRQPTKTLPKRLNSHYVTLSDTAEGTITCSYPNERKYRVQQVYVEEYDNEELKFYYQIGGKRWSYWSPRYEVSDNDFQSLLKALLDTKERDQSNFKEFWVKILLTHIRPQGEGNWQIVTCK